MLGKREIVTESPLKAEVDGLATLKESMDEEAPQVIDTVEKKMKPVQVVTVKQVEVEGGSKADLKIQKESAMAVEGEVEAKESGKKKRRRKKKSNKDFRSMLGL